MKIFISWSGKQSMDIAKELKVFVKNVIQVTEPFVSTEIEKGSQWFIEIATHLAKSKFGIICLTKENLSAPWILFETGALFKGLSESRVCTLLFGVDQKDISDPLALFNGTKFAEDQVFKLVETINSTLDENRLSTNELKDSFNAHYRRFAKKIDNIAIKYALDTRAQSLSKLVLSSNKEIALMQEKNYDSMIVRHNKYIADLNIGKFLISCHPADFMNLYLNLIENNSIVTPEKVCVFTCLTTLAVVEKQGGVWSPTLLNRYKKIVKDKKIPLEYVFYFNNDEDRRNYQKVINDYKSYVKDIYILIHSSGCEIPIEAPTHSIVLLYNRKWIMTHRWNRFYGTMEESMLSTNIDDWNIQEEAYLRYKTLSTQLID